MALLQSQKISAQQTPDCHFTIYGKIIDSENKLPISYVVISIKELSKTLSSDSLGNYALQGLCTGTYFITCNRIGFVQKEILITLSKNEEVNFEIAFDPTVFKSVEISSEKIAERTTQVMNSISGKELDATRGLSLGESLKGITGVNTLNTGSGIAKPVIHGLHSNRILILNNCVRQEGQQWGSEHAPEIDPFLADKITVIKGANAVRYGPDAIAGVILVEPKDFRKAPGIGGELNLVGFTNGRQGVVSGLLDGSSKKITGLTSRVQGTLKRSGNVNASRYYLKNSGLREYNYSTAISYNRKNAGAEIFYSQFNTDIAIFSGSHIGNLSDLQRAFASDVPVETSGFSYNINRPYQHIEHELFKIKAFALTGSKGKLSAVYARQYNLRYEYDKHKPLNDSLADLNQPELQLRITTHTADVIWEHNAIGNVKGQTVLSAITQGNTYSGRFFIPNFRNQGIGAFIIERWKKNKLELEVGVRYDLRHLQVFKYDANNNLISPSYQYRNFSGSIGAIYQWTKNISININAGSAWRPPVVSELYSNGLHHGAAAVEIGDVSILPENAYNFISAINYSTNKISFEISPYCNYIHHFIYLAPTLTPTLTIRGSFPTFQYKQIDATFKGIDFTGSVFTGKHLQFITRISLLHAFNKTINDYLILMPSDKYEVVSEYKFSDKEKTKDTRLSATLLYINKQWRVPNNSDFAPPPAAYFLVSMNASTTIKIGKQQIEIGISASNLLNKSYRDYMNRFRYYTDDLGRNISLRIKIPLSLFEPQANEKTQ